MIARDLLVRAPVVLEKVDSPARVGCGVPHFVAPAPLELLAGLRAGRGVDAELQPARVNRIGERAHVREFLVRHHLAVRRCAGRTTHRRSRRTGSRVPRVRFFPATAPRPSLSRRPPPGPRRSRSSSPWVASAPGRQGLQRCAANACGSVRSLHRQRDASRSRSLNLAADDSRVGIDGEAGRQGSAENRSGGVPVAGTRNRNGRPGVAPVTRGP